VNKPQWYQRQSFVPSLGSRSDIVSVHGKCDLRKLRNLTESSQKSETLTVLKTAWASRLKSQICIEIIWLLDVLVSVSCMLFVNVFAETTTNKLKINFTFM
jgi:hypothetical protein